AVGYDSLILLNSFVNWCLKKMNREKMSFSKRIKEKFKDAVKFINDFEMTAAELAVDKGYGYVVCGHIHQAELRYITTEKGKALYLNSGDWVENLTALEYQHGDWNLYSYKTEDVLEQIVDNDTFDSHNLESMLDINAMLERFRS